MAQVNIFWHINLQLILWVTLGNMVIWISAKKRLCSRLWLSIYFKWLDFFRNYFSYSNLELRRFLRAVRAIILKIRSLSLKHKWPISLQITTQCAYNSYKIWDLPFSTYQISKQSVLYFSAMLYFILMIYCRLNYPQCHSVTCNGSLLRLWRFLHGTLDV